MALREEVLEKLKLLKVAPRIALTYLIRSPEELAERGAKRDPGVENALAKLLKEGQVLKQRAGNRMAYYLPTGKKGARGNIAHDMNASLAAAKLHHDLAITGVQAELAQRPLAETLLPDWTLKVGSGEYQGAYYLEFHSAKNSRRNLDEKLAGYQDRLGGGELALIITESTLAPDLPGARFLQTALSALLEAENAFSGAIWHWGPQAEPASVRQVLAELSEERDAAEPLAEAPAGSPAPKLPLVYRPIPVPEKLYIRPLLWLADETRNTGIHLLGGRGTGKSRLMGRVLAWMDFVRGVPLVLVDPVGSTIDNFLDKLVRLPEESQRRLWPRVRYVDVSGKDGYVLPLPLYYRLGRESLFEISQRYLDTIRKTDPFLVTASVEGYNALWNLGSATGMILAALGGQITEAESLILAPKAWSTRFTRALQNYPKVKPAVDYFLKDYMQRSGAARARLNNSFLTKTRLFTRDPSMRSLFGAARPGISWEEVLRNRLAVLFDFRYVTDQERRRFLLLWVYRYLVDFILQRGPGRHLPLALYIDELSALTNWQTVGADVFAADLDELFNQVMRNYMVWVTVAGQELYQHEPRIRKTLLSLGTQIIGSTSDPEAAEAMARQFYRYEPYQVKREEPVWMGISGFLRETVPTIVDYRPVEFSIEEQEVLASYKLRDQGRFEFLVRPAQAEGDVRGALRPATIERIDAGQYVSEAWVAQARRKLSRRDGIPISEVLLQIDRRGKPGRIAGKSG